MKAASTALFLLVSLWVCASPPAAYGKALRVSLDESVTGDRGCLASTHILRACRIAVQEKYTHLIIEIDSATANLDLIDVAAARLRELTAKGITTVAFVRGECRGAALYLALHCERIYSLISATFSPFPADEEMDEAKKKAILDALEGAAEVHRGGIRSLTAYLEGGGGEWYLVTLSREVDVPHARKVPIPMGAGTTYLVDAEMKKAIEEAYPALVTGVRKTALPSADKPLTGSEALLIGLADDEVSDYAGLCSLLGIRESPPLKVEWFEKFAVFLTWPVILCLLITFGFLAFFIELHVQGTFIGAGLALLFLGFFFWSSWYIGTIGVVEPVIFMAGVLLLAVELFVIPGFGIIGLLGILFIAYGLFASFFPGVVPSFSASPYDSFIFGMSRVGKALAVMVSALVLVFVGAVSLARFLPETPVFKRLVHDETVPPSRYASIQEKTASLVGRMGVTATDLKPAGKVKIDGVLYDASSKGNFIPKGRKVKVVDHGFSIVVEEEI